MSTLAPTDQQKVRSLSHLYKQAAQHVKILHTLLRMASAQENILNPQAARLGVIVHSYVLLTASLN